MTSSSLNAFPSHPRLAFAASVMAVALVWGIALPWLSDRPTIKRRIEHHDHHGVDPSAMFYTELDAMERILEKNNQRRWDGL